MKRLQLLIVMAATALFAVAQPKAVTKDIIKDFGAKGDGKTNDHAAFEKAAAFFNARHGYGTLIIPKRIYIAGKKNAANPIEGLDVLKLAGDTNFINRAQRC